jgi:hypothetical protein
MVPPIDNVDVPLAFAIALVVVGVLDDGADDALGDSFHGVSSL